VERFFRKDCLSATFPYPQRGTPEFSYPQRGPPHPQRGPRVLCFSAPPAPFPPVHSWGSADSGKLTCPSQQHLTTRLGPPGLHVAAHALVQTPSWTSLSRVTGLARSGSSGDRRARLELPPSLNITLRELTLNAFYLNAIAIKLHRSCHICCSGRA